MTDSLSVPGVWRRLMSMAYDAVLVVAVVFIAGFLFVALTRYAGQLQMRPFFQAYLVGVIAAYYLWFWLHGGQTLAMKTWHIQLESVDGKPLTLVQAMRRFALAWLCFLGIGVLWAFFDRDRQFLHDRLAGTRLVTKK